MPRKIWSSSSANAETVFFCGFELLYIANNGTWQAMFAALAGVSRRANGKTLKNRKNIEL